MSSNNLGNIYGSVGSGTYSSCPSCGAAVLAGTVCGCQLAQISVGSGYPWHGAKGATKQRSWIDDYNNLLTPLGRIAMRMNWQPLSPMPFDYIDAHTIKDKTFVFIIANDQAVVIEDDELFPSDKLVTQLRLLAEKK